MMKLEWTLLLWKARVSIFKLKFRKSINNLTLYFIVNIIIPKSRAFMMYIKNNVLICNNVLI